jgi:rod shape-determining protein MreC
MSKIPIRTHSTLKDNIYALVLFFTIRYKDVGTICCCLIIILILNTNNFFSYWARIHISHTIAKTYNLMVLPIEAIHIIYNDISGYIQIMHANKQLREENSQLKHQLNHIQSEISYNSSLKNLLHVVENINAKFVTAKIISKNFDNFNMSFLINAGSKDGIQINDIVINDNGLIGRIVEVSSETSRILTITDPKSKLPVIFKDSGEQAILTGHKNHRNLLKAKYVSNFTNIKDNEQVITSGIGGIFPFGTFVGHVQKSNKELVITTPINWNMLDYIVVMIKK